MTLPSLIGPDALILLEVLSIDNLPTNRPLSRNDLKAWPYLKNVELLQIDCSVPVLIEVNISEAFSIVEERLGGSKELYAVRSKLSWAIIGKSA